VSATLVARGLAAAARPVHADQANDINHLDLPAIEQLEAALASYPGTLLLVTHDRRMLEAVTVSRRLEVAGGSVTSR
jgi:ABC-type lipoprotein export system ATPase subunit